MKVFLKAKGLVSLLIIAALTNGCASFQRNGAAEKIKDIESFRVSDNEPAETKDPELEEIPEELKPLVNKWLAYFQGRGRPHMERYLSRSTRYSRLMKRILRENGLPEDILYIALIESGFSFKATSHASAVGYWQFIRGTGKRYGLEINSMVDERRDPILSTQAAAEYFKGLYSMFGSWHLAMASYNVGENRVKKGVMKHKTRSFYQLAKKRSFPKETVNYIPKYLAAKLIGNNPALYGFTEIDYLPALEFEHIQVDKPVNLRVMAEKMGLEYDDLKQLNPRYRGEIAPTKKDKLELRVPIGQIEVALAAANQSFVEKVEFIADAGETDPYKVRRGDSLYTIAKKFKTNVAWLREVNDLQPKRALKIGQRLQVPAGPMQAALKKNPPKLIAKTKEERKVDPKLIAEKEKEDEAPAQKNPEVVTKDGTVLYVVQKGDNLSAIAADYGSSVEELRRMNKLPRRALLRIGMKLKVPKDEGLPTSPDAAPTGSVEEAVSGKKSLARATASTSQNSQTSTQNNNPNLKQLKIKPVKKSSQNEEKSSTKKPVREADTKPSAKKPARELTTVLPQKLVGNTADAKRKVASKQAVHVVRKGENLTAIAKKYQVSIFELKEKNSLSRGGKIMVGSRLVIPEEKIR